MGSDLMIIALIIIPCLFAVIAIMVSLCVSEQREEEKTAELKTIREYYKDALDSARQCVEISKVAPTEAGEATVFVTPTSGSYIATKVGTKYSPGDERFASAPELPPSVTWNKKFKAEFNLVFTPDNECGYVISGKGIDKYGQSIIEEGYMTNDGTFFWVEEYIASFATKWEDSSGNVHRTDVAQRKVLIKGSMIKDRNTLEGVWMMDFAKIKGGTVTMKFSPHGFAPVANIDVLAEEAAPVPTAPTDAADDNV